MYFTLNELYNNASRDEYCSALVSPKEKSYMLYGIKIIKDTMTEQIKIYNTTKGGDYYSEITEDEYKVFTEKGWRYGVYVLSLSNYRRKLTIVNNRIQTEIGKRRSNIKNLESLQKSKARILNRYAKFSKKLNKIKSNE